MVKVQRSGERIGVLDWGLENAKIKRERKWGSRKEDGGAVDML